MALNHQRAKEEVGGHIRWLRPDYQAPKEKRPAEPATASLLPMPIEEPEAAEGASAKALVPWPDDLPARFSLVKRILAESSLSATSETAVESISKSLTGRNTAKRRAQIQSILATLQSLGQS